MEQTLENYVRSNQSMDSKSILDLILPLQNKMYTIQEIDLNLNSLQDYIQKIQRVNNDKFDEHLDNVTKGRLMNLSRDLHDFQMKVMSLQCDITFAKEQYEYLKMTCDNPLVRERQDMLLQEENLRQHLQHMKFSPIVEFIDRFVKHLEASVVNCRKLFHNQASSFLQSFDWTHYHQTMFLLRACGKTIIDVENFENLYQSGVNFTSMSFKQPVAEIDLNNFIEFQVNYSVEKQLEIVNLQNQRVDFGIFSSSLKIEPNRQINYDLFAQNGISARLKTVTIECCKLLVDLNLNYIEAHFTSGINIDRLNGTDSITTGSGVLPLYAFSPQEYITQIGQHLLTLGKQTEQLLHDKPLKLALESLEQAQSIPLDVKSCKNVTEIVLRCIAPHCVRSLLARTNNSILSKLTANGKRQLATDALYLDNVLEDLGLLDAEDAHVKKFKSLLLQ